MRDGGIKDFVICRVICRFKDCVICRGIFVVSRIASFQGFVMWSGIASFVVSRISSRCGTGGGTYYHSSRFSLLVLFNFDFSFHAELNDVTRISVASAPLSTDWLGTFARGGLV